MNREKDKKREAREDKKIRFLNLILKEAEKRESNLAREYEAALSKLAESETGELIEKRLKNEAYAFLVSRGLLESFLDYREAGEDPYFKMTVSRNKGGLWIETI